MVLDNCLMVRHNVTMSLRSIGTQSRTPKILNHRMLDVCHLVFSSHSTYHYAVANFMNPEALVICEWYTSFSAVAHSAYP